jgi:hypothetical protein
MLLEEFFFAGELCRLSTVKATPTIAGEFGGVLLDVVLVFTSVRFCEFVANARAFIVYYVVDEPAARGFDR